MTTSRALQLERWLQRKRCPKCKAQKLIQRRPRCYDEILCTNCGTAGRLRAGVS